MKVAKTITPSSYDLLMCESEIIDISIMDRPIAHETTVKPILVLAYLMNLTLKGSLTIS